jgi:hypothetical protein
MREYISSIVYEGSGLTIGINEPKTCLIFGHQDLDEWVVLDENDLKLFKDAWKADKSKMKFDGFGYKAIEGNYGKGALLNQNGSSVFIHRDILDGFAGRWSGSKSGHTI